MRLSRRRALPGQECSALRSAAGCNIVLDPLLIYGFGMGVPRSGDRDGDLAGGIDRLGSLIPTGKKTVLKSAKVSAHGSGRGTSGGWRLTCPVYRAGKRERDYGLLQCLAAQIRGRRGGGSHDDSIQCDAVFHASDAGLDRAPSRSQATITAPEMQSALKDIPSVVDHKPVLFDGSMAFNHAVSADVCNDFFPPTQS